jgi:hypothetical protein
VYELEKQALEKADAIIASNDRIAAMIQADYGIPAARITSLKMSESKTEAPVEEQISTEIYNMEVSESNNEVVKMELPVVEASDHDWDKAARIVWQVLEEVNTQETL